MYKLLRNFFWLIPFFAFAIGYYAISFVFKSKTIQAPSLVGTCIDKAVVLLSDQNLNIRVVGTKSDSDLPEGTIISQTPVAESKIKENQTLYVVIAKKPAAIIAPDLKYKTISAATQIAKDLGLHVKTYAIPSNGSDQQCIAQFPEAGQESPNNTMIVYTAAAHIKPVIMPSFNNVQVSEVVPFLQLQGITPTILHTKPELLEINHQCTQCVVIDQRPLAGSLVTSGPEKPLLVQLQVQEK